MKRLKRIVAAAVLIPTVAALLAACAPAAQPPVAGVEASSTAPGTSAAKLVDLASTVPAPPAAPAIGVARTVAPGAGAKAAYRDGHVVWRSQDETKGAWIKLNWNSPSRVDHIRIDGAGGAAGAYKSAVVTFSDGSSVFVTPDSAGNVAVNIASRTVSWAKLQFVSAPKGVSSIALRDFTINDSFVPPAAVAAASDSPAVSVSSNATGSTAAALDDGSLGSGTLGAAWHPASSDTAPWVGYTWKTARQIASVQIAGLSTAAASMSGTLVFSDGSTLPVTGIASGTQPVDTLAFVPRSVTWVRLTLKTPVAGLGEFAAYAAGTTPPSWPAASGIAVDPPAPGTCSLTTKALGTAQSSPLALVCPSPGATVQGAARVIVVGPVGATVTADTWVPSGSSGAVSEVTSAVVGSSGRASIGFSTSKLPHGPIGVELTATGAGADPSIPLYIQLYNVGGVTIPSPSYAPSGLTLQYDDEFTNPLSVSHLGANAKYAATKPAGSTGSEFGDAVFLDPALGANSLATLKGGYLQLRTAPLGNLTDPYGWGRTYGSGLLSSLRVGGSGFSAQYGYFEARILAPAERGTWPAFWMLDDQSAVDPSGGSGEVDAVELYGNDPIGSCHTLHNWPATTSSTGASCLANDGAGNWALQWHTYGVRIKPGGADFYIDGKLVVSKTGLQRDSLPYYFMLDLSLGGGWPIDLNPTGGVTEMYVDWVRAYT